MSYRFLQRSILWLVPLLVLRAFVPAGYMVATGAEGLQLSLCSGQMTLPGVPAAEPNPHAAHHMQQAAAGGVEHAAHHGKHFDSPCPFGIAAVGIATSIPHSAQVPSALTDESVISSPARIVTAGPLRSDRIRGPPALS